MNGAAVLRMSNGTPIAIKNIRPSVFCIDTYSRFNHENLSKGEIIIIKGNILVLTEAALYSLKDYIKYARKNENYFVNAEYYADNLVKGLSYLHKNGLCHNNIVPRHCLIKHNNVCCLTDFSEVKRSDKQSIIQDNKNLGKTFVELFTFSEKGNVSDFIVKFNRRMPYQDLLFGRSYEVSHPKDKQSCCKILPSFKSLFCQLFYTFSLNDTLEYVFLCIHNLHRQCELMNPVEINVIRKFTNFCLTDSQTDSQILECIYDFKGVLLPNTVYTDCVSLEDLQKKGKVVLEKDYLTKSWGYNNKKDYTLLDIKDTELYNMMSNAELYI